MLEVEEITKSFGATRALRGVSLSVAAGEIYGLCGRNGAGKSTLVKILTGIERPDSGVIRFLGEEVRFARPRDAQAAGIAVIDQELSVVPALSVEENVRLGALGEPFLSRRRISRPRVSALLERVGLSHVSPSAMVEDLSMAERQLVEVARLLDRDARLLILDEPTASLSLEDSQAVFRALRQLSSQGTSVLYVSHRLGEVLDLCSQIAVLRDGSLVADQPVSELEHASLVSLIVGEDFGRADQDRESGQTGNMGPTVAESEPGREDRDVRIEHVSVPSKVAGFGLKIPPGQIVALAGQVGSGTTEVLRALAGLMPDSTVVVSSGGEPLRLRNPVDALKAGIFFISNDRKSEGLFLIRSVEHNLLATRLQSLSTLGFVGKRVIRRAAQALASRVAVSTHVLSAPVATLSGGNQQKVFIGRCLDRPHTRLLLLDEPTRGVDVRGRESIHDLIRTASSKQAAVVFASSEPEEILELADIVVSFQNGEVVSIRHRSELNEETLLTESTRSRTEGPGRSDAP